MKGIYFSFVFLTLFSCLLDATASGIRPNVIVIVADDLGYADMSFLPQAPGDIQTPSIDRLAKEGTYFGNAYSTSPICSPSRAGLITGRYQQRWGNYWYGQGGLPKGELTIPKALRKLGYSTHKIGKTHLNGGDAEHPLDHGFDDYLGFNHHTWDYIRLSQKDLDAYKKRANGDSLGILCVGPLERNRGEPVSYENGFTTEIFTDEVIRKIEAGKKSKTPFFIELEYNAVHMPTYIAHPEYAKKAGCEQPKWNRNAERWTFPFWDPRDISWSDWHKKWGHLGEVDPLGRKRYLANLMALDDGIGRILDSLEKTDQRKNTLVIFLSDNGGTINTYANNTPLRGFKYMFGEGGVRIPLVVSWLGQLPEGKTRDDLSSAMDVFPTILEICGGEDPGNLDGRSLVGRIRGLKSRDRHDHLCFTDGKKAWSIRQGNWKLIETEGWIHANYRLTDENIAVAAEQFSYPKGLQLFNLKSDIGETKNVAERFPKRVASMKTLYDSWRANMGEPRRGKRKKRKAK